MPAPLTLDELIQRKTFRARRSRHRELLEVAEDEEFPVVLAQPFQDRGHQDPAFLPHRLLVGRGFLPEEQAGQIRRRHPGEAPPGKVDGPGGVGLKVRVTFPPPGTPPKPGVRS